LRCATGQLQIPLLSGRKGEINGGATHCDDHGGAGKGSELAQAFKPRCIEIMKEPSCEQFEVFQSEVNPDKLAIL